MHNRKVEQEWQKEVFARASAAEARHREIINLQDKALLIRPDGTEQEIRPANGRRFTQGQVRHLLGATPIYCMQMIDSFMFVGEEMLFAFEKVYTTLQCDETGCMYMRDGYIFTFDTPFNERATKLWGCPHDRIHGNVVMIPIEQCF